MKPKIFPRQDTSRTEFKSQITKENKLQILE